MADVLDPEPTYETAVEAVLGDALQYILVEDQQAGMAAIDYLQSSGAGRSGFIPVEALKPDSPAGQDHTPADRLLLNHIQVRPGCEAIAESLLGHVIFAETLGEAIGRFNENGRRQTIVTRSGDVVSSQGMLIGGSQDKLSGILAKKQELKELEALDRELGRRHAAASESQSRLESNARDLETELQVQLEKKADVKEAETEAERQLYEVNAELKSARNHLEVIQLEQEQLIGEASDIDEEMSQYHQALANIATRITAAQEAVATTGQELAGAEARQDEFNRSEVNLKLEVTALNAKLENATSSLKRLKEFQADGLKRLEELTHEILQKKQKQTSTRSRSGEIERTLAEVYEEIETLAETLSRDESDYEAIDAQLKSSDDRIASIRTVREKTLEKLRLLELEQSQRRIKQENIAAQLADRYRRGFDDLISTEGLSDEALAGLDKEQVGAMEAELSDVRTKIARITDVNLGAIKEYEQLKDRYDFLETQRADLEKAIDDLHRVIRKINTITQKLFMETFVNINDKMSEVFPRLFNGGSAKLVLVEPEKPLETGVELMIHPPGKKLTRLSLLSGGEKALSAIAFLFSIFLIKPASFCLLDEIDAPLDDANVFRFNDLLQIIGEQSQIIMITHNKHSMEFADMLFGITMEQKGISKVVSVNLERSRDAA
jgi:chromosome segregation protein